SNINTCTEDGYCSVGNTVKTSDSDFSDTEGRNLAKLAVMTGRLRQTALGFFLHAVKVSENRGRSCCLSLLRKQVFFCTILPLKQYYVSSSNHKVLILIPNNQQLFGCKLVLECKTSVLAYTTHF